MCAKVLESVKGCRAFGVLIQREVRRSSSSCSQDWRSPSSGYVDCHVVGRIVISVVLAVKDRAKLKGLSE